MTAPWSKAVADLRLRRGRSALVVLAMAVGLAGFFAVLSSYAVLRRELNAGYLATNPASAVLTIDAVDEALLASMRERDDVADADARRVVRGRVRSSTGTWHRLVLFAIRDFDNVRISAIAREPGVAAPGAGAILIERDAFQVAPTFVGDLLDIELRPGESRRLRVSGAVHDAGQAQARMENTVYGYITPETLRLLGETATLDRLYLLVSGNRLNDAHVRQVANDVKGWLERRGHVVARVSVPTPGEHPHAAIMGLLLLAMTSFGGVVLVISGVIVLNLMTATMATQRRDIAIMKAVGGSPAQIAGIYLAQALLLGVVAVLVALPPGRIGGAALTDYLAVLLNFDITSHAVPPWVYLLVVFVGVAVPLAASSHPVRNAAATGVRTALDRSPVRPRTRMTLALVTLTGAGTSFMTALNVRTSMLGLFDRLFRDGRFDAADRYAFDQHMLMIYAFLLIAAGILGIVGALGMMTSTTLNVVDRRRELGVLRAIGATPARITSMVVAESVSVAALSWLLAVVVSWPLSAAIGRLLTGLFSREITVTYSLPGVGGWLLLALTIAVTSSAIPAALAARRSIREAVSHE